MAMGKRNSQHPADTSNVAMSKAYAHTQICRQQSRCAYMFDVINIKSKLRQHAYVCAYVCPYVCASVCAGIDRKLRTHGAWGGSCATQGCPSCSGDSRPRLTFEVCHPIPGPHICLLNVQQQAACQLLVWTCPLLWLLVAEQ